MPKTGLSGGEEGSGVRIEHSPDTKMTSGGEISAASGR